MADQKLTALTADTSPTSDDLLYVVNSPGGTPGSRKVAMGDAITKGHGLADGIMVVVSGVMTSDTSGLDIANGGTGATTAAAARTALGLAIGTNVQAYDAELAAIAGLTSAADLIAYFTGSGTAATTTLTTFGRSLIDDVDAATARTTLALGTVATLASDTDTTLAANSDTRVATQKAVKAYVDTAVTGLLDFKGATDASANPNYPSGLKGDTYVITVAGKVGGASGKSVDIGDVYLATADNAGGTEASVGTSWSVLEHNLVGALIASNNLSDLTSASTARTNLGLGTLATQSGTFSGTSSGTNTGDQTITLTGDVTGSGTGSFATTIPNNSITNAKSAQMAANTMRGNNTGSTANVADLTVSQVKTLLGLVIGTDVQAYDADLATIAGLTATTDNFLQSKSSAWASRTPTQVTADLIAVVGDSGSGGTKGLVPAPGAGDAAAGKYLSAAGTFTVPSGGGSTSVAPDTTYGYSEPLITFAGGVNGYWSSMDADRQYFLAYLRGNQMNTIGLETATYGTYTFSNTNVDTEGPSLTMSIASAGASAALACNFSSFIRGTAAKLWTGFKFYSGAYYPDASYDNTGASTGSRIFVGLTTNTGPTSQGNSDTPTGNFIGFRRNNTNGGATDTTWQFITRDGTTQSTTNTTMTWAVSKFFKFYIRVAPGGTTAYWRIENVTDGTSQNGTTTTNLPVNTTAMSPQSNLYTVDAVTRTFRFKTTEVMSGV